MTVTNFFGLMTSKVYTPLPNLSNAVPSEEELLRFCTGVCAGGAKKDGAGRAGDGEGTRLL